MTIRTGRPTAGELRRLSRQDPKLGRALVRLPSFPGFGGRGSADSHFHSLARTIIHQQLAGQAAATIHGRVHGLTPGPRFPTPEQLLVIRAERLRKAGLSGAKQAAIKDLARKIVDGDLVLRSISRLEDQAIIDRLTTVRGIGPWSAQMFLIFRLGRLDVLPSGDLGVQEGLRILDELPKRPSASRLEARGADWAPLRSVATWALYRLVDEAREA
jgi:3-methyladenine DNA glycosylase/8-oxoguanine DNA glycosylase